MGIAVFPAAAGGGIKSVQRGLASGSGNVTITSVDISKSFVTVFGTTSSGTVAATGAVGGATGTTGGAGITGNASNTTRGIGSADANTWNANLASQNVSLNSVNITGGTNNLVAAVVQGYLSNSTTLVVSGACRWEVVEFA